MRRVAVVAEPPMLRTALVVLADAGAVEIAEVVGSHDLPPSEAARRLQRIGAPTTTPALAALAPDLDLLEAQGRADLLAGEAALDRVAAQAVGSPAALAVAGWAPADTIASLGRRLAPLGGAVVTLPRPPGVVPPTLLRRHPVAGTFAGLVQTYATVPYSNIDPTLFAAAAYVVMFGFMFGDAGHGLLLVAAAVLARLGRPHRLARLRRIWVFLLAVGLASTIMGLAYGEFFGPTGVLPVLWLRPLEHPVELLATGLAVGAVLLAVAYALGTVNRVREGGWAYALYSPAGLAGATVFLGAGLVAWGAYGDLGGLLAAGIVVAVVGLGLSYAGLMTAAGGGVAGAGQAIVELVDLVVRLGSNVVSFARLAAFGLTHAALGLVVWQATTGLWGHGVAGAAAAVVVFVVGNALAFALEALVAGVQALRLEYYELFSRVFQAEGRPFQPWHVPVLAEETTP
jgi:V/A-type H+-transporting ATPase subunit I